MNISQELRSYIETNILPVYATFDGAHQKDHIETVIEQSIKLAEIINTSDSYIESNGNKTIVDIDMVYAIAAYHDTGLTEGRATHHTVSARIMREDKQLRKWFGEEEINIMADAVEDHRASAKSAPRTIYGRIVAEADRAIHPTTIIKRTIQYGLANYPNLDKEGHYQRTLDHMAEKYAEGGYLKLWIPESPNGERLAELRNIIRDEVTMRQVFEEQWEFLQTN